MRVSPELIELLVDDTIRQLKEDHPELEEKINRIEIAYSRRMTWAAGRARGSCNFAKSQPRITVSLRYFEWSENLIHLAETVIHEVAHCLAGCEHGHRQPWKQMMRRLGEDPVRCHIMTWRDKEAAHEKRK